MKKINKKIIAITTLCLIGVMFVVFMLTRPSSAIEFNDLNREIEINSIVDFSRFVDSVKKGTVEDIVIDDSQVKMNQLGKYDVQYKLGDETKTLTIEVVDTTAPKVQLENKTILFDYPLQAKELVKEIKDATKTEVKFKEDYSFDQPGKMEVIVVVTDEGKNTTEKAANVTVLEKDEEKPVIKTDELTLDIDSNIELKNMINVTDNQDKNVKVTTDESTLKRKEAGDYKVKVTAIDASGNKNEKEITIHVVKRVASKQKIVYLTFDDGPSRYTKDVLKILDKYNAKATFFVTGMNKPYYSYMKTVVDKGHTIGLHTYSHNYGKVYKSTDAYFADLKKIQDLVEKQTGLKVNNIRFPGGSSNTVSRKYSKKIMSRLVKQVEKKGFRYFDWNCENGDGYSKMAKSEMIRRATSSSANQVMILMHDANGKKATVETLPKIIEYYQKKGYQFKAIDETTPDFHQHVNN